MAGTSAVQTGSTVYVEGLAELTASFTMLAPEAKRNLLRELKNVGEIVAVDAKAHAPVGKTGRLRSQIKPARRGSSVLVQDAEKKVSPRYPSGFPYPRRIEFEQGGARAFLRPALQRQRVRVEEATKLYFEEAARESGFR